MIIRLLLASAVATAAPVAAQVVNAPAASACSAGAQYGGGFKTSLGSGWTSLARRTGPCTGSTSRASYGEGSVWTVRRETHGQFICRGRVTYNYGTDVWFKNYKNEWSWSGGTTDARWDPRHGC